MTDSVQQQAFEAFVERVGERLGDSLRRLSLYGSVAKGEEGPESDVDVFAIVEEPADKRALHDVAFDVEVEYGVVVSIVVRTADEYDAMAGSRFDDEVSRGVTVV